MASEANRLTRPVSIIQEDNNQVFAHFIQATAAISGLSINQAVFYVYCLIIPSFHTFPSIFKYLPARCVSHLCPALSPENEDLGLRDTELLVAKSPDWVGSVSRLLDITTQTAPSLSATRQCRSKMAECRHIVFLGRLYYKVWSCLIVIY